MKEAFQPQVLRLFPEKLFYKIGEAGRLVGVESYVLRYWESEFPFLSPRKSRAGQRIYTKKDIDLLLQIKRLLHEERYTIDGVRKKLGGMLPDREMEAVPEEIPVQDPTRDKILFMVKTRLKHMLETLS
ncbi:MAG TPA: MerR family transcriptional regulator [Dissulfurispiraceae bacterium]|nr:MerR family transcriptional regulator [Dissulfurispiraceae bacterium]